ncbi:hypothetical protein ZOSMA_1G01570 [Zostera marina]|uniref:Uncharacterized protein n=1 Tax=Zostera marina TaxID=29655 RepID=A0A0K9PPN8_ZOSMR|nr:hypothetical protein ZOSMA_1G01570 [Zostera marina]
MVLQEEQRCNSSSGNRGGNGGGSSNNNRSYKKAKQDKIPQRGLGVAELERILQDQQRNSGGSTIANTPSGLVLSSSSFRTTPPTSTPLSVFTNSQNLPRGGHDGKFVLPYAPNPILLYSQQQQQQQQKRSQQQPHNPMVNPANTSFLPSSSGVNVQMELPSSQINLSSNYTFNNIVPPPFPAEERTGGVKRPSPFLFDSTLASGSCKFPIFTKPDYSLDSFKFDHRSTVGRDNNNLMSGPSPYQVDIRNFNHGKGSGENGNNHLHKETSYAGTSISKYKQSTTFPLVNYHEFHPELSSQSSTPLQMNSSSIQLNETSTSQPPLPFYEFLPTKKICHESCSDKEGEESDDQIDLNLKL